jgi:hypothetical protein
MIRLTHIFALSLISLLFPKVALAVCPVCTLAVGAGLGFSRYLGIDDTITGLWIGGLILSSGLWLGDFFKNRLPHLPQPELIGTATMLLFVIPPLYLSDMIGLPANTIFGVDKIIAGTLIGSLLFLLSVWLDRYLRSLNDGKVYIYYQKVLLPLFLLSLASYLIYILI